MGRRRRSRGSPRGGAHRRRARWPHQCQAVAARSGGRGGGPDQRAHAAPLGRREDQAASPGWHAAHGAAGVPRHGGRHAQRYAHGGLARAVLGTVARARGLRRLVGHLLLCVQPRQGAQPRLDGRAGAEPGDEPAERGAGGVAGVRADQPAVGDQDAAAAAAGRRGAAGRQHAACGRHALHRAAACREVHRAGGGAGGLLPRAWALAAAGVPRGDTVHGVRGAAAGGDARAQQRGPAGQHGDLRDGRRLQAGRLAGHVPAAGDPLAAAAAEQPLRAQVPHGVEHVQGDVAARGRARAVQGAGAQRAARHAVVRHHVCGLRERHPDAQQAMSACARPLGAWGSRYGAACSWPSEGCTLRAMREQPTLCGLVQPRRETAGMYGLDKPTGIKS
mmetsp:Transcript_18186/g.46014  ORF Transcript_18186/g.46014 Transcript_18186/m.46014 type:complete len:390 (-) Transcript_18186:64-1233(-)